MVFCAIISESIDSCNYNFPLTSDASPPNLQELSMLHQSTISEKAPFRIKKPEANDQHIR